MYIEKLKKENFEKFGKEFGCSLSRVEKIKNNEIYIEFFTGCHGPQPQFWLSDFFCRASTYYKRDQERIQKAWRKNLYEVFGESYKTDLLNEMKSQVEKAEEDLKFGE